ncbi:MAG: hypothetical protein ABSF26_14760 [Thermoguttaceae bacterium]|jgi:hypothetical protein
MLEGNTHVEDRRGGPPQQIGDILAELLARYQSRFPSPQIEPPVVMEDQSCLFCPAEMASAS